MVIESITIYPKNEKQKNLLRALLEEMKIRFEFVKSDDDTLLSKKSYFDKVDESIKQAEEGNTKKLTKDQPSAMLGL